MIEKLVNDAPEELLLDGRDHGAAAELLHVVEHVVDTALVIHDELIRIHTELVDHGVVHGLRTVLGKHEVVGRGGRLLVGVTADEVLGVRSALDEVRHSVDVDEFLLGDVPAVDDEVDVEPDLGDFLDIDGLLDFLDLGDDLVHDLLIILEHAHAVGQAPLAVLLADIVGETGGDAEVAVELVVQGPTLVGALLHVVFTIESIADEGSADVEQEVELVRKTELVHETQVEGGAGNIALLLEAVDDTTTRVSVDLIETIRLVTAENIHQVRVGEGIGIHEPALLDSELIVVIISITGGV